MALRRKFQHAPIVELLTILGLAIVSAGPPVPPTRPDRPPLLPVS